jgi:cyclopropane-fatty-acyl-phospholipid synthase
MLLPFLLRRLIRHGRFSVIDAAGDSHEVIGSLPGPSVSIRIHSRAAEWRLCTNPALALGEAYMDGSLSLEAGSLEDLLALVMINLVSAPASILSPIWAGLGPWRRWFHQFNPIGKARRNVAHHYDLSNALYELFLDTGLNYSCAYFADPEDDLETAQANKLRHIASKLALRPGQRVLDIGSGWGALALYLAAEAGVDVTGLTLSVEQHSVATARAAERGLADRVRFHLRDYREETGSYDRIVSVGMFEHVGVPHYQRFFEQLHRLLTPDGVALVHAIGQHDGVFDTNPWIRKYIFPGGYIPALSDVLPRVERADLWVTDLEIWRLHYAKTLRHWSARFAAGRDRAKALYDERFCRMWEFYLAGAEAALRHGGQMVFQMQLAKAIDAMPITRDYMIEWERAHRPVATPDSAAA